MKRIVLLLLCAGALFLSACGSDSKLPVATGKASVRAINAIPTSEEINFLIEERVIGSAAYAAATSTARYDDLDYTFNFEVFFAGETSFRRVASQHIDFQANTDYTLFISGALTNPTITLWEDEERTFAESDTVFEAKFVHASVSRGALDYYFADPAVAPALGNQVATLSFGEISAAADYATGDFVLTITTAGDPNDVVYASDITTFVARGAFLVTSFDGSEISTAPIVVRALNTQGGSFSMLDPGYAPTAEFVNASMDLGTSDIYDDELLTSQRVAALAFPDVSAEIDIAPGTNTFYFTPTVGTGDVTLESSVSALAGTRYRLVATGAAGALFTSVGVPDRRPVETHAKLPFYHAANNFNFLDLYAVQAGQTIDDAFPIRAAISPGAAPATAALAAGSYDIYVTEFGQKVVLAGPYRIDVTVGDIVDTIIVDNVDPAVLDVLFLSGGPTP